MRNSFLPRLILFFPCMIMIFMPWAMNLEVRNISLNIVDNDHSVISRRLVDKIAASTYFRLTALPDSYDAALRNVESGDADVILEIPHHFERNCTSGNTAHVLIAVNAVNGTKGGLGSAYLSNIIRDYASEVVSSSAFSPVTLSVQADVLGDDTVVGGIPASFTADCRLSTLNLYNPNLNYKLFMVPALMVMLLTLICGFLPALNIVGEKEAGTIEQINVTPVGKFTFILAKLLPYWLIGFVVLTICFILAWVLYGITPVGHFLIIYFFAVLFVLSMSGLGLVISNHSATMQQSMFVMWFCMLVLILMSGLFTPISSMPEWAQVITVFNPLKYLMQVMRMVYLKGSGMADLLPQLGALLAFALVLNIWAVKSFKKVEG
ncbi:putative multidrug ABC transporter permease YbhR [Bacteroides salyersiae]|nr:putative multidrug ABC transporter permease YbhR [Bacteroides salyersiae]